MTVYRRIRKIKIVFLCIQAAFLVSCVLMPPAKNARVPEVQKTDGNEEIILDAMDIIITEDPGDSRIIEIYKDEVLDNCERRFIDMTGYYRNGELLASKILFDNLLESLEYLYGDRKVSDTEMLNDFWNEFSDQNIKNSGIDIFDIYNSLYLDESLFSKEEPSNELVIEKTEAQVIKQNNPGFLYVEEKVREFFSASKEKVTDDFVRIVYESYNNYLSDKIGVKETYIRSQKYVNFIKTKLKDNGLSEVYCYIPAVMTSFYEGSKNGSIWRVENIREYRSFRNNTGASTALVIKKIKELSEKKNEFRIIATILEEEKYNLSKKDLVKDIYTDNFANFVAMAIILSNPVVHGFEGVEMDGEEESKYFASYESYIKNPSKFKSQTGSGSQTTSSSGSKYSKSFIRIMYKVQKGDNLDKIADLFKVRISDLKKWNPKDTSKKYLYPGMSLYVQGNNFQYYVARSGDSIGRIASRYKMKESDFKKINGLRSNTIYKGRKYIVRKR